MNKSHFKNLAKCTQSQWILRSSEWRTDGLSELWHNSKNIAESVTFQVILKGFLHFAFLGIAALWLKCWMPSGECVITIFRFLKSNETFFRLFNCRLSVFPQGFIASGVVNVVGSATKRKPVYPPPTGASSSSSASPLMTSKPNSGTGSVSRDRRDGTVGEWGIQAFIFCKSPERQKICKMLHQLPYFL